MARETRQVEVVTCDQCSQEIESPTEDNIQGYTLEIGVCGLVGMTLSFFTSTDPKVPTPDLCRQCLVKMCEQVVKEAW
jgi:hypothetical protein